VTLEAKVRELAALIDPKETDPIRLRQGIIADVGMGRVSVQLDGPFALGNIPFFESYRPIVGDVVWIAKNGPDMIVIGPVKRGGIRSEPWHVVGQTQHGDPDFENGWFNYGFTDGVHTYGSTMFYKDVDGFVHLQGLVRNTSGAAYNSVIFTLPVGYRPESTVRVPAVGGATSSCWMVEIRSDGTVRAGTATNADVNLIKNYFSLCTVFFEAAGEVEFETQLNWVPFGELWDGWGWDYTSGTGNPHDYPAAWLRWDGLVRCRSQWMNGTNTRIALVPESAARTRWAKVLTSVANNSFAVFLDTNLIMYPWARELFAGFWGAAYNLGLTIDGLQWWAGIPESYWTPLELMGSWARFADHTTWPPPAWYKDGYGHVHLRGEVSGGSTTFDDPIAQLPEQCRPLGRNLYKGWSFTAQKVARVDVDEQGTIRVGNINADNTALSLDLIFFRAQDS